MSILDNNYASADKAPAEFKNPLPANGSQYTGTKLEPKFHEAYAQYTRNKSPETTGRMLRQLGSAIDTGMRSYAGNQLKNPIIRGQAKQIAVQALRSYDPTKSALSTHIVNHLQRLKRRVNQHEQVLQMPERALLDRRRLYAVESELSEELGRDPTITELSDKTRLPVKRITKIRNYGQPLAAGSVSGADAASGDTHNPAVEFDNSDIVTRAVYDDLAGRDQKIMEWTLGLYGAPRLTNAEIAQRLRITPGAVSQRKAVIQRQYQSMQDNGLFH